MGRKPRRSGGRVLACPHCGREILPPSLTYAQAAWALGVSKSTILRLVDEGQLIRTTQRKRARRITQASITGYLRKIESKGIRESGYDEKDVPQQLRMFQDG